MRAATETLVNRIVKDLNITGDVLEIGAFNSTIPVFKSSRFSSYSNFTLHEGDAKIDNTIIGDVTKESDLPDKKFDLIVAMDVFEHINRPWKAAANIAKMLKPGGHCIIFTVWSWRYHPCPIDYWRFSPECLKFLFEDLNCLESDFDLTDRRKDVRGFWKNGLDAVPVDELGGWREHWGSYYVGKK